MFRIFHQETNVDPIVWITWVQSSLTAQVKEIRITIGHVTTFLLGR